jgi:cbb3-type cytochrome c oxidase subunit III
MITQASSCRALFRFSPLSHGALGHLFLGALMRALAPLSACLVVAASVGGLQAATPPKGVAADLAKGQAVASAVCIACHAADGNSAISIYPILAGQHAGYLAKQLHNFQVKQGAAGAERANAVMAGFAASLSEKDINNVTAYYAAQAIKPSYSKDKAIIERGQRIYRAGIPSQGVPACAGCHGPNGRGIPAQYPRLSGQHADYTAATLAAFKSGERANSTQMMSVSKGMNDGDMKAVAEYLAGLR